MDEGSRFLKFFGWMVQVDEKRVPNSAGVPERKRAGRPTTQIEQDRFGKVQMLELMADPGPVPGGRSGGNPHLLALPQRRPGEGRLGEWVGRDRHIGEMLWRNIAFLRFCARSV